MRRKSRSTLHLRGFTLIELLVVIAVLGLLAGLLFPVFASAKREAKRTSCMGNLDQIGRAVMLYQNDSDGVFPLAVDEGRHLLYLWSPEPAEVETVRHLVVNAPTLRALCQPYVKSMELWHCPEDNGGEEKYNDLEGNFVYPNGIDGTAYSIFGTSYAYRPELGLRRIASSLPCSTPDGVPVSEAQVGVLVDSGPNWHAIEAPDLSNKSVHVSFADGHVSYASSGGQNGLIASWSTDCGVGFSIP